MTIRTLEPGTIIHGTGRIEDIFEAITEALWGRGSDKMDASIARARDEFDVDDEWAYEVLYGVIEDAHEFGLIPHWHDLGTHEADGSDWGVWHYMDCDHCHEMLEPHRDGGLECPDCGPCKCGPCRAERPPDPLAALGGIDWRGIHEDEEGGSTTDFRAIRGY